VKRAARQPSRHRPGGPAGCHFRPGPFRQQASVLRRQFLQDGALPFADVLTEEVVAQALAVVGRWLDQVFSPLVTLWVFLGRV